MAWISEYYLMYHTGTRRREDYPVLEKVPSETEERLFYGTYWTKRRQKIDGVWGTAYLLNGDRIPPEIQKAIQRYHNMTVLDYTTEHGRYRKGKAIFVADRPTCKRTRKEPLHVMR